MTPAAVVFSLSVEVSVQGCVLFLSRSRRPPGSTLFPYTTLFRSHHWRQGRLGGFRSHESNQAQSLDRKSTRLNSSHDYISYAVFCLKKNIFVRDRADHFRASDEHVTGVLDHEDEIGHGRRVHGAS